MAGRRICGAMAVASLLACGCAAPGGGWEMLIEGNRGMENLVRFGSANWHVEADALVADQRADPNGYSNFLATRQSYKDFELRVEFWASDDANSGIFFRCSDERPMTDRTCYEANIFDQRPDPSFGTGAIVHLVKAKSPVARTGGRWNTMEVRAQGGNVRVALNGVVTAETQEAHDRGGIIGLQYAGGTIRFRKLAIRRI